jgi:hypothetical protein
VPYSMTLRFFSNSMVLNCHCELVESQAKYVIHHWHVQSRQIPTDSPDMLINKLAGESPSFQIPTDSPDMSFQNAGIIDRIPEASAQVNLYVDMTSYLQLWQT